MPAGADGGAEGGGAEGGGAEGGATTEQLAEVLVQVPLLQE